jgi:hypothetical protein
VGALVLTGCSVIGLNQFFDPVSGGDVYTGEDAATITVTTEQIGCCYVEGALRFARLDGRDSFSWAVDDGSGEDPFADASEPPTGFVVGVQRHSVRPGDYTLTAWEQVCNANCDFPEPPTHECRQLFTAPPGGVVDILVTFEIPADSAEACEISVQVE